MLLVIDNYDSFTYNLVQYFGELGAEPLVKRNDEIAPDEIATLKPERIVISPGPCTPNEAGISCEVIRRFGPTIPLFGVCLGHQTIGQAYGAEVVRARKPSQQPRLCDPSHRTPSIVQLLAQLRISFVR